MSNKVSVLASLNGRPCFLEPSFAVNIPDIVEEAMSKIDKMQAAAQGAEDFWDPRMARFRPYNVTNGVLSVPVDGLLLGGFSWHVPGLVTGLPYIEEAVLRGVADPEVSKIALKIASPGGTVYGTFEATDILQEAATKKPIVALVDYAYSAAYAIASTAHEIFASKHGGVGSIGVIMTRFDYSERLNSEGVKVHIIKRGERKADGSPYTPMSEDEQATLQKEVDSSYDTFVALVAAGRGMDEKSVRDTEAACFSSEQAVLLGLVDRVGSLREGAREVLTVKETGESKMEVNTSEAQASQQDLQAAVSAAVATAVAQERTRISAILNSDEAAGRTEMAVSLAVETDLTAEQAKSVMSKAPKEAAKAEQNAFVAAMSSGGNPEIGAMDQVESANANDSASILAHYKQARGIK
jgi:signal peptide peptidase SppA